MIIFAPPVQNVINTDLLYNMSFLISKSTDTNNPEEWGKVPRAYLSQA